MVLEELQQSDYSDNVMATIQKLKEMFEQGVISEDEFNAKKQNCLNAFKSVKTAGNHSLPFCIYLTDLSKKKRGLSKGYQLLPDE